MPWGNRQSRRLLPRPEPANAQALPSAAPSRMRLSQRARNAYARISLKAISCGGGRALIGLPSGSRSAVAAGGGRAERPDRAPKPLRASGDLDHWQPHKDLQRDIPVGAIQRTQFRIRRFVCVSALKWRVSAASRASTGSAMAAVAESRRTQNLPTRRTPVKVLHVRAVARSGPLVRYSSSVIVTVTFRLPRRVAQIMAQRLVRGNQSQGDRRRSACQAVETHPLPRCETRVYAVRVLVPNEPRRLGTPRFGHAQDSWSSSAAAAQRRRALARLVIPCERARTTE